MLLIRIEVSCVIIFVDELLENVKLFVVNCCDLAIISYAVPREIRINLTTAYEVSLSSQGLIAYGNGTWRLEGFVATVKMHLFLEI